MSISLFFLLLAVCAIILEVFIATDGYFLWIGSAALITAFVAYLFPLLSSVSIVVLFCFLLVLLIGLYRVFKYYRPLPPNLDNLNLMATRYLGKVYQVVEVFDDGTAKIQTGDTLWRVRCDSNQALAVGAQVRVIDQISSNELKVINLDDSYQPNQIDDLADTVKYQLELLINSQSAKQHTKLTDLFRRLHHLYTDKPDFNIERSSFYHSYLPQTLSIFKKLDAGIELDEDEHALFVKALEQLSERFEEIIEIDVANKKIKVLAKIDVLNTISKH